MKRLLGRILTLIAVTAVTLTPIAVKADPSGYSNFYPITITDTSAANRYNVPVIISGITGTTELNAMRINASGTDTDMTDSTDGSAQSYMMDTAQTMVVVPYIPASGSVVYNLYMGTDATQTSFPLITGTGGYITTTDHANLELGSSFEIEMAGYLDTSYVSTVKNLLLKTDAIDVSVVASETLCAKIPVNTNVITQSAQTTTTGFENYWQTFTTGANGAYISRVRLARSATTGTPAGYLTIKATAAGSPTGDALATSAVNSLVGGTIYYDFARPIYLAPNTMYAFVGNGYSGANRYVVYMSNANPYADGTYLGNASNDLLFYIDESPFVEKTGVTSGEHTVTVSHNGSTLSLDVDGSAATATTAVAVPDNANNLVWADDNTFSYLTSVTLTQGATERIHYEPAVMLTGTAVVNLASGGAYPGVITWGANADLTVTVGALAVAPSVITNGATNLAPTSATLQGTLQGMGDYDFISMSFEYGTTTAYGSVTSETTLTEAGTYALVITGLNSLTTYHYRAVSRVATTTGDIYWRGVDRTFTTLLAEGSTTDIQVRGANIFSTYSDTGDMLICIGVFNKYSNYFPNERPGDYFQVQFIDSSTNAIIGTTALPNWGYRPCSVYLKPSIAATVTPQGSYYIKMIGYGIVTNPEATYDLQVEDWKGNNLSALDNWCIGTAKNMQINDEVDDYIVQATDKTEILSDAVGAYFTTGIPGISTIRPNLFNTVIKGSTLDLGTASDTWTDAAAWEAAVGTGLAADLTKFAAPFGVNPQEIFEIIFWIAVVVFALWIVGNGMNNTKAIGGFLVAVPALYLVTQLKIVSPNLLIVLFILAIILFVVWFFQKVQ